MTYDGVAFLDGCIDLADQLPVAVDRPVLSKNPRVLNHRCLLEVRGFSRDSYAPETYVSFSKLEVCFPERTGLLDVDLEVGLVLHDRSRPERASGAAYPRTGLEQDHVGA
jgi:hypothetical protein